MLASARREPIPQSSGTHVARLEREDIPLGEEEAGRFDIAAPFHHVRGRLVAARESEPVAGGMGRKNTVLDRN